MILKPLDCFIIENLGKILPKYDCDLGLVVIANENRSVQTMEGSVVTVPMFRIEDSEMEHLAWRVILTAAQINWACALEEIDEEMKKRDLKVAGFVRQNGHTLAVAEAEFVGRIPVHENGNRGIACFNLNGVIQIHPNPSDDEMCVREVLE